MGGQQGATTPPLTRGQKAAATRAANAAAKSAGPEGVNSDDLMAFLESLEATRDNAIGFGTFESAVITADFDGAKIKATYDDGEWRITL
jgi:hypothetical protein